MVDRGTLTSQEIRFMDETITINAKVESRVLSRSFTPDNWSVICGRGKQSYAHIGNKRLKVLVESKLDEYMAATSKIAKTLIVSCIVDTVRDASKTGGFVKLDTKTGQYYEVGDAVAREKVGQLLRESMAKRDPVKLSERKQRRRAKAAKKSMMMTTTANNAKKAKTRASVVSNDGSQQFQQQQQMPSLLRGPATSNDDGARPLVQQAGPQQQLMPMLRGPATSNDDGARPLFQANPATFAAHHHPFGSSSSSFSQGEKTLNQVQLINLAKLEQLGQQHVAKQPFKSDKYAPLPYHDDDASSSSGSSSSGSSSASPGMNWLQDLAGSSRSAAC